MNISRRTAVQTLTAVSLGVVGLAMNLEEDNVGTALFGDWFKVKEGQPVRRTGRVAQVPVSVSLTGGPPGGLKLW